jgi:acyl carrier protein
MGTQDVIEVLKEEIQNRYGREVQPKETDTLLDLGFDSLDTIELWLQLEEIYNITISETEAKQLYTVTDVIRLVEKHVSNKR